MAGWIGVDLDGTLAHFDRWRGPRHIGLPIPAMAKRVHDWHARGVEVRIFTARASRPELIPDVHDWLKRNGFPPLAVTNQKDFGMVELWDDRAIQVLYNTGKAVRPSRLQDVEKADIFDPDEVYADDLEDATEVKPSSEEVETFKRNIKASTDNSLHSLDDLLDALDDGEYSPGESPDLSGTDSLASVRFEETNTTVDLDDTKDDFIDLPIDATGFVSPDADEQLAPKNALVEVDLSADELIGEELIGEEQDGETGEEEIDPELSKDETVEIDTMRPEEKEEPTPSAKNKKKQRSKRAKKLEAKSTEPQAQSQLDATLDDQPQVDTSGFGIFDDIDNGFDLSPDLEDDVPADIRSPEVAQNRARSNNTAPTLTVFPEDELDDLDDLPAFRVERR